MKESALSTQATEGCGAATARPRRHGDQITIDVDRAQCKACGICIALCGRQVFDRDHLGYPVVARPQACTACMLCDWHCPDLAIEVTRRSPDGQTCGDPSEGAGGSEDRSHEPADEAGAGERVTAAVKAAHKLSGSRRELPPDAEPRGTKED